MKTNITKEQLDAAQAKYPASNFISFWWKSFWGEGFNSWKISLIVVFFVFNIIAIILDNTGRGPLFMPTLIIGNGYLCVVVIYGFIAVTLNNLRIRKIRKELGGISAVEYNELVNTLK